MGFFDFFKKRAAPKNNIISPCNKPTSKLDAEIFVFYSEVFQKEMTTITAFSKKEIKDMYAFIKKGGSPSNLGHYYHVIFEQYFKNREWFWPEYEKMELEFRPKSCRPTDEIKNTLEMLKVPELKELLKLIRVPFEQKTNKKALVSLALNQPLLVESLSNFPAWIRVSNDYVLRERKAVYSILMRTLMTRAKSLHTQNSCLKLRITKAKWIYCCYGSRWNHPGHKEADGKIYDISKGLEINRQYVYPGMLIDCGCVSGPLVDFKD